VTLAGLLVVALVVSGCVIESSPQQEPVSEEPRTRVVLTSVSGALAFARWVGSVPAEELQAVRPGLERAVQEGRDPTALFRLSLVLHEARTPDADPERARQLLTRFIEETASAEHEDLRTLAMLLIGSWREQALLTQALRAIDERAKEERAGRARERERRVLAEKRLEALIDVERRVKRAGGSIKEVKPVQK